METNQIEIDYQIGNGSHEKEPAGNGFMVLAGVSARQIIFTQEPHVEILFGPDTILPKSDPGGSFMPQRAGDHSYGCGPLKT